jgi:hypothetical protein
MADGGRALGAGTVLARGEASVPPELSPPELSEDRAAAAAAPPPRP